MDDGITITSSIHSSSFDPEFLAVVCVMEFFRRGSMTQIQRDFEDRIDRAIDHAFLNGRGEGLPPVSDVDL